MKTRLGLILFAIGLLVLFFGQTFLGICAGKLLGWPESRFKGKPLEQLQNDLKSRNEALVWCDPVGFTGKTDYAVKDGQRVMLFQKGKPYSWFHVGTAVNVGYVVIQHDAGSNVVVDIIKGIEVDSL